MATLAHSKSLRRTFGLADPEQVTDLASVKLPAKPSPKHYFLKRITMTPEKWHEVPENPRQRKTEDHAERADHLSVLEPLHHFVSMAMLPDGSLYKLDGHSRSHLWHTHQVEAPPLVHVDVMVCEDIEEVKRLYDFFDSKRALKTTKDAIYGGVREAGIVFKSAFMSRGRYATALKHLHTMASGERRNETFAKDEAIFAGSVTWKAELLFLDSINPPGDGFFSAGIVMAVLASYRRHGEKVRPFWVAYARNEGSRAGAEMDGPQALRELVARIKLNNKGASGGNKLQGPLCGKALQAVKAWLRGRVYATGKGNGIKPMSLEDIKAYVRGE